MAALKISPLGWVMLRTVSITALAALAALDWPRAAMIAAPRCCTVAMKSPCSHASSGSPRWPARPSMVA